MHLALKHQSWFCSSNLLFYLLFHREVFFLFYVKDDLNTYAFLLSVHQEAVLEVHFPNIFVQPQLTRKVSHWLMGDCSCLFLFSKTKPWSYLCEMDYNNNSLPCPKALTYTRFLNWDHPYLLPYCQTLAPIMGDLQKTQSVRWYFVILCKKE